MHSNTISKNVFIKVFMALIALTIITISQPYLFPSELAQTVSIQMFISVIKAVLIGAYYTHLKYESPLFRYIVATALITLGIFFIILSFDAIYRNEAFDYFT